MRITESWRGVCVVPRATSFLLMACVALLAPALSLAQSATATGTAVAASPTILTLGDTVTLTATVTAATGTPTGLVTFFDSIGQNTPLGSGTLTIVAGQSQATFSTSLLSVSPPTHLITAVYQGDATHTGSTSPAASVTVNARTSTAGVVLNPTTVVVGQPNTATVTVTDSGSVPPGTADTFTTTGAPATGRTGFTATLFGDGLVLVAGGTDSNNNVLNTSEIYVVSIGTFSAPVTQPVARTGAVAVLLPTGKILIAGGSNDSTANGALNTAELFDPGSGSFTATSHNMTAARFGTTATLLYTGKVLLAGGVNSGGALNSAELYDPVADTFTATGNLNTARTGASTAVLNSGKVLIVGGSSDGTANGALNTAELFDPAGNSGAGTFSAITGANSTLSAPRWQPEAVALPLGTKVLIAGGQNPGGALASADLYDWATNTFTVSNHSMRQARANGSAVFLPNGMVLLAGGTTSQAVDLYDPESDKFDSTGSLQQSDSGLVAVQLNNGDVLMVGLTTAATPASDAELYAPSFNPLGTVAVTSSEATDSSTGACVLTPSTSTASTCTSTITPANVATNPHTITGTYPADAVHSGSSNTASLTVNKADTTTTIASSVNPSVFGQSVTFTATVSPVAPGSSTPTGTVTFLDGGSPIGTGTLSGGFATFTTSALAVGIHTITTSYGGDGNFNGSTGSLTGNPQVVNKADTATTVTSSVNPSVFGQSVTFTATVSAVPPGSGTPTGTVTFLDGGSPIGTGTLSGGVATFTTSALVIGNHTITTSCGGDGNFNGSTGSLTGNPQVVNKADTATTVTSSVNPSVFGQSVTFTATVSAVAPGPGTPTGTVTFLDGGSPIGTATLPGGATPQLVAGSLYQPSALSVAGPNLFFATGLPPAAGNCYSPTGSGDAVMTVSTNGGAAPVKVDDVDHLAGNCGLSGIVTDSNYLYWLNYADATIKRRKLDLSDSPFIVENGGQYGNSIVIDPISQNLYWHHYFANPDVIYRAPTSGGGNAQFISPLPPSGVNLAVDSNYLYWTEYATSSPGSGYIYQAPLNASIPATPAQLASGQNAPHAPAVSSSAVYWLNTATAANNYSDGALMAVPLPNGAPTLTAGSLLNPVALAVDANNAYVLSAGTPPNYTDGKIYQVPLGGGSPVIIANNLFQPQSIALDANYIYWSTNNTPGNQDGSIWRVSKAAFSGSAVATFTTSALAAGNHTITTSYGGDGNFNGSTGSLSGNPQVVNKADTATTVTSSVNPSVFGQSVTFTATVFAVAPGSGTPTGTVTFLDGGSPIGTGTLSGGIATFTTSALAAGNHTFTTSYGGDGNFNGSTGSLTGNPQVVNQANSTTTVTSSQNPSVFGQSVTFTATVSPAAPGAGTPTGVVTFLDSGNVIGARALSGGIATFMTSALAVGNHTITSSYAGDGNFNGSTGSLTGNPQVVNKAITTTTVTSSVNPSLFGQSVSFTATVSAVAPGAGTPTGTVTFLDGGSPIGTGTLSGGIATFTTSALAVGNHTITTSYGGDGNFNGSTGSLTGNPQVVNKANTATTVTSSANPSVFGQSVTFTATVSAVAPGSGTPTGTVTFLDGGSPIGSGTLSGGIATFTTSALAAGTHTITTSYGGDGNFSGSTGSLTGNPQVVNRATTTTALSSSLNPAMPGNTVTFTATVTASPSGTPTGTVTFKDGSTTLGSATLNASAVATFSTTTLAVGSHSITAVYNGDSANLSSTSSPLSEVVQENISIALTSNANPSLAGNAVTFTATVTGSGSTPTGTVTFKDGAATLGSATLNASGVATLSISSLAPGQHSITAVYSGDAVNLPGTSGVFTQTVDENTITTLTASAAPALAGSSVTFTATVSASVSGTPTGSVAFKNGSANLGTATLNASGVATLTTSILPVGTQSITAVYSGDTIDLTSTSSTLSEVIQENTTVAVTSSANPSVAGTSITLTATVTGSASGTPSGTVTFKDGAATLGSATINASGVATLSTSALTPGQHSVTASYGGDSVNLSATSAVLTQTVQQNTSTALISSANPSFSGGSVTFTATVTASVSGTPTGSVTFKDGTTALGTASLNASGVATFSAATLSVASHTMVAVYSGDAINLTSTSAPLVQTVSAANFTITANPASQTITDGQSATFTLTVTPQGSFTTPINFSCTGLPLLANCLFTQSSVTPNSSTVTNSLTITTVGRTGMLVPPSSRPSNPRSYPYGFFASLLALVAIKLVHGNKKRSLSFGRAAAFAWLLLLVIGSMAACAGGNKPFTPTGMSQVQVTATSPSGSGSVSHSATVTLTIQ